MRAYALLVGALCLVTACASGSGSGGITYPSKPLHSLDTVNINASLYRPQGDGPFPAIIVLHGCDGLATNKNYEAWARRIADWGYVTILPDSFGSRGRSDECGNAIASISDRVGDVYGAAAYLRGLPFVRADRIGMIGFSHGGWTVMEAGRSDHIRDLGATPLQAAVAYYPVCTPEQFSKNVVPTLVFIGDLDDWNWAINCESSKEYLDRQRSDFVTLTVYPGVHHGFDEPGGAISRTGHHVQFDRAAYEDSLAKTHAFFDRILKK